MEMSLIVQKLTEGQRTPAPSGERRRRKADGTTETYIPRWSKAYIRKILTGRAVLGEYQPYKPNEDGKPVPDGPPVLDFYPQIIDEATWHRAQGDLKSRRGKSGREGRKTVSMFAGLLWDALTGEKMHVVMQPRGRGKNRQKTRVIVAASGMEGHHGRPSFQYPLFEKVILKLLKEVSPDQVLGDTGGSDVSKLEQEMAGLEVHAEAIKSQMTKPGSDVDSLSDILGRLASQRKELTTKIAEAKQQEANPRDAAWSEAQSLIDLANDKTMWLRLRGLLRTTIDTMQVVIAPRRSGRMVAVQVYFKGGSRRDYLTPLCTGWQWSNRLHLGSQHDH